jgi:hypothetical protein
MIDSLTTFCVENRVGISYIFQCLLIGTGIYIWNSEKFGKELRKAGAFYTLFLPSITFWALLSRPDFLVVLVIIQYTVIGIISAVCVLTFLIALLDDLVENTLK